MPTDKSIADSTYIETDEDKITLENGATIELVGGKDDSTAMQGIVDDDEILPILTAPKAVAKPQSGNPPMPPNAGKINRQVELYVLQELRKGEILEDILDKCGICKSAWYQRLTKYPPLNQSYREALKAKADCKVQDVERLVRTTSEDTWHADKVKLLGLQWLAGVLDRDRYGPGAQTQIALQQQLAPQITIVMGDKAKGNE